MSVMTGQIPRERWNDSGKIPLNLSGISAKGTPAAQRHPIYLLGLAQGTSAHDQNIAVCTAQEMEPIVISSYVNLEKEGVTSESWLKRFNDDLQALAALESDWDSYGSQPPNMTAIELARTVLEVLAEMGLMPLSLAPSPDEGVSISFLKGKRLAAIECFNTGEIVAVTSDGSGSPRVWGVGVDREAIREALEEMRDFVGG